MQSVVLVLGWCGIRITIRSLVNDRKMTKFTISSDLVRLLWQHRVHDDNFKRVFLYNIMLSFNCEENINIIKMFYFSQNIRPNMDLINPSPLVA